MFNYLWWDLKNLKIGQTVKVDMATAANVKLLDYDNFTLYKLALAFSRIITAYKKPTIRVTAVF